MKSKVAIVRCAAYEPALLDRSLAEAVELAPLPELRGASVLVKPNLLNASAPERAVTTRPELLAAFLRLLKARGAGRLTVGDSPGFHPQEAAGRRSGLREAAEAEGAAWVDFAEARELEYPEGRRVKRFSLAAALGEADLLVTLPKLKTHGLLRYTGAIKNLFGLVPGLGKSAYHLRFPDPGDFGAMLVDLALAARPAYALMDAVIAMEGRGPNNGRPRQVGLVLGSPDPLALDWAAASLIGYDPAGIAYLAEAAARCAAAGGPWIGGAADIEYPGLAPEGASPGRFELVGAAAGSADIFAAMLPGFAHRVVRNLASPRPFFDRRRCTACGACVRICPPGALELAAGADGRRRVAIDRGKCIRCYCCDEICPSDAIHLARRPW
ncbi:MAG TPA: DUF362 domain-containing protein [Spirochaetales bacterium]|nr:DUF362 domain-containing protein [Spirochaetales bacterium]HRY54203.1 DUF362 domain-containing protein [Spirochaetia bacterium]HRZ64823.1 DUF362 domain-containing protein [Spirochaetia bacterium]